MNKTERVCAVVVTYNRKDLLLECLEGLLQQSRKIDSIYLIDNASADGTQKMLFEHGYLQAIPPSTLTEPWEKTELIDKNKIKLHYVRMHKNTGGAGGFYEGIKRASQKGYEWLWLMDDDVEPEIDSLEKLMGYKDISGCIHPIKKFTNGELFPWSGYICDKYGIVVTQKENFKDKGFCVVNYGCFEGMLVSTKIVKQIGYPKREFFLAGDDAYYGYLASKYTNVIYTDRAQFVKKIKKSSKSDMYLFYVHRNFTYFLMEISRFKSVTFAYRFAIALQQSVKYRSSAPIRGFVQGVRGRF